MRNLILAILATLFTASVVAATVLVEAEAFNVHGGWTLDAQHMGVMGSPYLLAHGLGDPVENAATEFFASESGDYDVYVRTRNWTAPWSKMVWSFSASRVSGRPPSTVNSRHRDRSKESRMASRSTAIWDADRVVGVPPPM